MVHGVGILFNEIPLIYNYHRGLALFMHISCDAHILFAHALACIHHDQRHICPAYGAKGTDHAIAFDGRVVNGPFAADAGGIHQGIGLSIVNKGRIDGVPGGTGDLADDGALIAQQGVYQAGFTHVWLAHDGDRRGILRLFYFRSREI